jgi:glutathione S-transferase
MAGADLAAVAWALGDAPYFAGDRPRAIDASVFGVLANLWFIPIQVPLRRALGQHANLIAFVERMRAEFASDVPAVVPS